MLLSLLILLIETFLDCALGRLGLPAWFRKVYFSFHRDVRLRFKLAAGFGVAWTRDGGIPSGLPSEYDLHRSPFILLGVAISVLVLTFLLNCMLITLSALRMMLILFLLLLSILFLLCEPLAKRLLPASVFLLSTSKAARKRMTSWRNRNEGCFWAVKLDVRDLGGHLDVTLRAVAGYLNHSC